MAEGPDPLERLRADALAAFEPAADTSAPGLRATLLRAVDYATLDPPRSQLVIDRRALLLAMVAVGLEPAFSERNSAGWFAQWLASKLPHLDLARICADVRTSEQDLQRAAANGFAPVPSASVRNILKGASAFAQATVNREKAALRHLFFALIGDPNHKLEIEEFGWSPSPADIADLRMTWFERIAASPERGEKMEAWQELIIPASKLKSPPPTSPPSPGDGATDTAAVYSHAGLPRQRFRGRPNHRP